MRCHIMQFKSLLHGKPSGHFTCVTLRDHFIKEARSFLKHSTKHQLGAEILLK